MFWVSVLFSFFLLLATHRLLVGVAETLRLLVGVAKTLRLLVVVLAAAEALVLSLRGRNQRWYTRVIVIRRDICRDLQTLGREQHADLVGGCALRLALGHLEEREELAVAHPEGVVAYTERALEDSVALTALLTDALDLIPRREGSEARAQCQSQALSEVGDLEDLVDLGGVHAVGILLGACVVVVDGVDDADLGLPAVVLDLYIPRRGLHIVGAELLHRHRGLALSQLGQTLVVGDRVPREEFSGHHAARMLLELLDDGGELAAHVLEDVRLQDIGVALEGLALLLLLGHLKELHELSLTRLSQLGQQGRAVDAHEEIILLGAEGVGQRVHFV